MITRFETQKEDYSAGWSTINVSDQLVDGVQYNVVIATELDTLIAEVIELRKRDALLSALEAGGVDNWEWYSESIREHAPELLEGEDE